MLKITVVDSPSERRLILEGRLTESEISELQEAWQRLREVGGTRPWIVDLRGATFIDPKGEVTLMRMKVDGAVFVACGVSTTHQLSELGINCSSVSKNQ